MLETMRQSRNSVLDAAIDPEIERLRFELSRAYRCIRGFWTLTKKGEAVDKAMLAYHSPTIAAACRFVAEGAFDGSEYFIGKNVSVMHEALGKDGETV